MTFSKSLVASLAVVGPVVASVQLLAPSQDIRIDLASETATKPLEWLGANSPWFAGPNVNDISSDIPANCYVQQASYNVRHGSRYPDSGAYSGWVSMQERFSAGGYSASGSLSFMPEWKTVLTNPALQIAMESPTGYKEAHDLGYTLRTRYPDLYNDGESFIVWANNYTRVLQTAQMFVRGYLGAFAPTYGSVVSVTSKGFAGAVGDSLSPGDMCPNFVDTSGADQQDVWTKIFVPPILERLQGLIDGNLTLTESDVTQMPYLCGFESQITGRLSPWCGVYTDDELKSYELYNDLRYWYGIGPGTKLPATMMMPYLNALVQLLQQGPGVNGTYANGSAYALPKLLMAFMNDGQISELATATGVFDGLGNLSYTERDDDRLFMASRFVTMRGTIAFEVLNCEVEASGSSGSNSTVSSSSAHFLNSTSSTMFSGSTTLSTATRTSSSNSTATGVGSGESTGKGSGSGGETSSSSTEWTTSTIYSTTSYTVTSCASTVTNCPVGHVTTEIVPITMTVCPVTASETSSPVAKTAGSGSGSEVTEVVTVVTTATTTICPTETPALHRRATGATTNATYIRIRLNDAVYPLPSCRDGPGSSCLLSDYADYIAKKYAAQGNWATNCNVTTAGAPSVVQGASFFTDLSSEWLQQIAP